jgi:hypothetical protein
MYCHIHDYEPTLSPALWIQVAGACDMQFQVGARLACKIAVDLLNADILGHQKATTLAQIAKAWNHGNWADSYDDSAYVTRAEHFYTTPMPNDDSSSAEPPAPAAPHPSSSGGAAAETVK